MSLPRRQTTVHSRHWAPGAPRAVAVITSMLGGWAASQFVLWAFGFGDLSAVLQIDAAGIRAGEYWRFFTHQLFHANAVHALATVLIFYFAGREVEPIIGRLPFIGLCLAAGAVGGVVNWLTLTDGAVLGFSAAAAAVLTAYAMIMPELEQRVLLFLMIPVRLRAKWLAASVIAFAVIALATRTLGIIGPAGILTGCIIGWAWARQLGFGGQSWVQRRKIERRDRETRLARMDSDEFIASEVDPILEKIARDGMRSLSRSERNLLEMGRRKLASAPERKR